MILHDLGSWVIPIDKAKQETNIPKVSPRCEAEEASRVFCQAKSTPILGHPPVVTVRYCNVL